MNVRTHTFNGVRYRIEVGPFFGMYEPDDCAVPAILLPLGLPYGEHKDALAGLRALLHEWDHLEHWGASEDITNRRSRELARLLWRLGHRRVKPKRKKGK